MPHLFISYAKIDTYELALKLEDALNTIEGVTAWVDRSLRAGRSWELQIQHEIDRCDTMIVLYSPDINRHKEGKPESYVLTEIAYAKYTVNKLIIPIMAQQTDPPLSLTMEHYIDFTKDNFSFDDLIEALCLELNVVPPQHESITEPAATTAETNPTLNPTEPVKSDAITHDALDRSSALHQEQSPPLRQINPLWRFRGLILGVLFLFVLIPFAIQTISSLIQPDDSSTPTSLPELTPILTITANAPIPTITTNDQWTLVVQEFDGVEMVMVPPGCFMMGSPNGDSHELPINDVCFDNPFWIDRFEVTNAQYGSSGNWSGDNLPRESVTWSEARAYCQSRDARLPTEAEWEYAASGPDNLEYPWGNEFIAENVIYRDGTALESAPVGSRPGGVSWVGAFDLSGNVWEWTNTVYDESRFPYPYTPDDGREDVDSADVVHVLRGGSWGSDQWFIRTFVRVRPDAGEKFFDWGFRCVRDYTIAPAPTPVSTITTNDQWTPVVQEFDGVEMVLVPAGCFMMGSEDGEPNEQPVNDVCFRVPFWIDRYEVTQGDFARLNGKQIRSSNFSGDFYPVENIDWFEARDFCTLRGGRLPTEAEWEYAARGPENLVYPWGNTFEPDNVVYKNNSNNSTASVGSRPFGISWVGAHDLSGNVWEWVNTAYDENRFPYPYQPSDGREGVNSIDTSHVIRGGAWDYTMNEVRAAYRNNIHAEGWSINVGFRCARDYTVAPMPTPIPTVTANNQWTPLVQEFDGAAMVLVPAGCFMMGSEDGDSDERPVNQVCFAEPFWIDRYEVTNEQYGSSGRWDGTARPREGVNWLEALAHCQKRDAHLPTEAQWEYAARGPDNLIFPWGNAYVDANTVSSSTSNNQTADVGSRPGGVSWVGAYDLSGNVFEWVSTRYDQNQFSYPYVRDDGREDLNNTTGMRVIRGGAWNYTAEGVNVTGRGGVTAGSLGNNIGFRCARDYE